MRISYNYTCTASGGVVNALISARSDLFSLSSALRASSRAGNASESAISASAFSVAICLLCTSTSADCAEACCFFLFANSVAVQKSKREKKINVIIIKCDNEAQTLYKKLLIIIFCATFVQINVYVVITGVRRFVLK